MEIIDLGRTGYHEALEVQKRVLEDRIQDRIGDTLILVEHQPIYTVGRAMSKTSEYPNAVAVEGLGSVPVVAVDRGGKMTWHGPGQIVGYPVFKLVHRDLRRYLRDLERVMAVSVQAMGLNARPTPENLELDAGQLETGLWVGNNKIASIGIHVRHWVGYHGFALNVHPDLRYFQAIQPCGFNGSIMSSIAEKKSLNAEESKEAFNELKDLLGQGFEELNDYYFELARSQSQPRTSELAI